MEVETNFKNTELHALFPCPIQISKLADAVAVNKRLMLEIKRIKKNTPNGRPEVWTSPVYTTLNTSDQLHLLPEFTLMFPSRLQILVEIDVWPDRILHVPEIFVCSDHIIHEL